MSNKTTSEKLRKNTLNWMSLPEKKEEWLIKMRNPKRREKQSQTMLNKFKDKEILDMYHKIWDLPSTRLAMSLGATGKILTEKHKKNISISCNKPEVKKLIKEGARKGSLNYWKNISFEDRLKRNRKITNSNTGKKRSKEIIMKFKEYHNLPKIKEFYSNLMSGNKNPNWLNGISLLPYDKNFTKSFKKAIILRDGCCLICGRDKNLYVHHIDYNKLNSTKENCCALCNSCNCKANFNRPQWTQFFQSLLIEKYNYYYITKEVNN